MATLMTTFSELGSESLQKSPCLLCGGQRFKGSFKETVINNHSLGECLSCGMVQALPVSAVSSFDYSSYGDYLLLNDVRLKNEFGGSSARWLPYFGSLR